MATAMKPRSPMKNTRTQRRMLLGKTEEKIIQTILPKPSGKMPKKFQPSLLSNIPNKPHIAIRAPNEKTKSETKREIFEDLCGFPEFGRTITGFESITF